MNTSSEKYKIKASIWKHPRILEVLGKQIAEELEEKKDEYAKELQEKKDRLDRLDRLENYHTALQSIRITTDLFKANNPSYAFTTWEGAKNTAFDIFGSWNFMNDIDESDLIGATRDLKNKIVDKFSEDVI